MIPVGPNRESRYGFPMHRFFILILFSVFVSVTFAEEKPLQIEGAKAETYKTTPQGDLRIHRFDPPEHDAKKDKAPAIVLFFGGGWVGGTPTHFEYQGRYLSQRGLVVFLPDYRTRNKHKTTPRECVADGKSAIRWVRKNAEPTGRRPESNRCGRWLSRWPCRRHDRNLRRTR